MRMIIEAQCKDCGKHIGYASLYGGQIADGITYVRHISHGETNLELLCDECRVGRIDLDEVDEHE